MSTKLFNGYYIDSCTLMELQNFSMSVRAAIIDKIKELYAKKLLELSTYYYDKKTLYNIKPKYSCSLTTARFDIDARSYNIEKTNIRDPEYDFSFDVTFIPTETKILTLIYTEQKELIKVFESLPNVHKYPYWNNTDKPDNISDTDWELRGDEWNKALEPYDIPALQGFSIKCLIYLPFFTKEELNKYSHLIPTLEKRVTYFAKNEVMEIFYKRYKRHYNVEPKLYEYIEWIETRTYADKLTRFKNKIRKKLNPEITKNNLLEDI